MVKIIVKDTTGNSREIHADEGISLMENIRANDFDDLAAICGGSCSCCTCHVHVAEDWYEKLPAADEDEKSLLEDSEDYRENVSRLSCQIEVKDSMEGITVTIVPEL